jgi:endonuclease III
MLVMASLGVDEKRRLIRRLLDQQGRGIAEACGFPVTNSPSNLFAVLYLAMLAGRHDYRRAVDLAQAVRQRWDTATAVAAAEPEQLASALRSGQLGSALHELAQAVVERHRGDLRRLRTQAGHDPGRERQLITALPGIDDRAADLFIQEIQVIWPELAPFVDQRAMRAASRLGLAQDVPDLVALTGDESEKLAWLAGALERVDQDGTYDKARALARA